MRLIITTLALLVALPLAAQWSDSFDDGNFSANPLWQGDTAAFAVTTGMLQLNAPSAAASKYLSTASNIIEDATWEFYVRLDFNPSSSNYTKVYLVADQADLLGGLNGYFVKLGGTPDEVSLYRQQGTATTLLIDGQDGRLSLSQVRVNVRVSRSAAGNWQLETQLDGESGWTLEGNAADNQASVAAFFGVVCTYTSTRSDKFYFDNFVVNGQPFTDNIPPQINTLLAADYNRVVVSFSEPLDTTTAMQAGNYLLNGAALPAAIAYSADSVTLAYADSLAPFNTLALTGLADTAGNIMPDTLLTFYYVSPEPARPGDVVFNELLSDPSPPEDLPEAEFVELRNNSRKAIDMTGWSISDKVTVATLSAYILLPDSLLILCRSADEALFAGYGAVLGLSTWPSLNNSGDSLALMSAAGETIDLVAYNKSWYRDSSKEDGGWSLEGINPRQPCNGPLNWQASTALAGGTPGQENAVYQPQDSLPPVLLAHTLYPDTLVLTFDEPVATGGISATFSPSLSIVQQQADYNKLLIIPDSSFTSGTSYTLQLSGLADCLGNVAPTLTLSFIPDFQPPVVDTVYAEITNMLTIVFDEPIAEPALADFDLTGIGMPASLTHSDNLVRLTFDSQLTFNQTYTLQITNQSDTTGNKMTGQSLYAFIYQPLPYPAFGEVLISEIMADPEPAVGLPAVEYLELANITGKRLQLHGVHLADALSSTTLEQVIIEPHEQLILCPRAQATSFASYGKVAGLSPWPSLNNAGDNLVLLDTAGQVIHYVAYTDDWYDNAAKAEGGWALELLDTLNFCAGDAGWSASIDPTGGTPGHINSLATQKPDLVPPHLSQAIVNDNDSMTILFSEPLQPGPPAVWLDNQVLTGGHFTGYDKRALQIGLSGLEKNREYGLVVRDFADCAGNRTPADSIVFVLPDTARPGEVVVNEVLFNPLADGADFVELYNPGTAWYDLYGWQVSSGSSTRAIDSHLLLSPGGYLVLTPDPLNISDTYPYAVRENLFAFNLPTLPNEAGVIGLYNGNGTLLDTVRYDETWHFAYLRDVEGVSLERLVALSSGLERNNWASAAGSEGYATPGYANSQQLPAGGRQLLSVSPQVISPDGDGRDDLCRITLQPANPASLVSLVIYNLQGQAVRELANNLSVGSSATFVWDGTDSSGSRVALGHYMLVAELFTTSGQTERHRIKVVVATGF